MSRKLHLRDLILRSFRGSPYHSFMSSLNGVSERDARWVPPAYKGYSHMDGTILNLAYHTGGDKFVLMSTCFGAGSLTWPRVEEKFGEMGGDLAAAIRLSEEGVVLVLETLEGWPEERLDEPRPYLRGKTHTAYEIFSIVAEHDVYHAGQINYIKNLIAGES